MRSKAEIKFSQHLRENKVHYKYESQSIKYRVSKFKSYTPDFPVRKSDGTWMYLEVKGWFRSQDRSKILYVVESNPGIDLRLVFERDNRLNKDSETYYSDWAEKYNIKYTVGLKLPEEWLQELKAPKKKRP